MKQKEIKVLMVAPGEHPKEVVLENSLDALQKAVSIGCDYQGLIEVVILEKGVCIICNEEGKKGKSRTFRRCFIASIFTPSFLAGYNREF